MEAPKFTQAQAKAIFETLHNQTSPFTPMEKLIYDKYKDQFPVRLTGEASNFERLGNKVRQIEMDKFGEDYRNCWIKVYSNSKGEYFTSKYIGKRIYID